ncbi:ArsI/CadI family heavy metal resistance metalloenzyme [Alicyclobacillus macrosporangiidus]|uniref:ArsI/CadI family heavy metal resistance metalloenzyme n=1 Tax=Alicyclobacillus macrosporangiidus TaxID=392015 RepID=UPI00068C6DA9
MYTHVGIRVTNLQASIDFYTKLFGAEPVKVKPDYAKFLLEDPPLNFTLNVSESVYGNQVSHFGLQVKDSEEVVRQRDRLEKLGLATRSEMNVTCCYSVQDKFWVVDPDGNEWEFFVPKEDVPVHGGRGANECCDGLAR